MITQMFQYIETQVLPNLNKNVIRKILSQKRKLFAYLQECQQNLLILEGNYVWTLSVSFLDISDRKKILNFSGKNAETHISENKTQVGHQVLTQRNRYHKFGTYYCFIKTCYSLP